MNDIEYEKDKMTSEERYLYDAEGWHADGWPSDRSFIIAWDYDSWRRGSNYQIGPRD